MPTKLGGSSTSYVLHNRDSVLRCATVNKNSINHINNNASSKGVSNIESTHIDNRVAIHKSSTDTQAIVSV